MSPSTTAPCSTGQARWPHVKRRISRLSLSYAGAAPPAGPLFERHDCAGRLAAALEPEVVLPGGARLTIEETRALCAIDVDTSQTVDAAAAETADAAGREIVPAQSRRVDRDRLRGPRRHSPPRGPACRARACTQGRPDPPSRARRHRRRGGGGQPPAAGPEPAAGPDRARRRCLRRAQAAAGCGGPRGGRRRPARGGERGRRRSHCVPRLLSLETLAAPGDGVLERWLGIPLALIADRAQPHGRFSIERR